MMRSIFFCNETGLIKISLEATFLVCQIGLNNNILGKYRPNSKQLLKEMIINAGETALTFYKAINHEEKPIIGNIIYLKVNS